MICDHQDAPGSSLAHCFPSPPPQLEFYETIPHTVTMDVQARTDTLEYVVNVLGAGSGAVCALPSGAVEVFRSRLATAQVGARPLNFTAGCSTLEAGMQAAAAVPAGRDARVPTSRVSYETVRVTDASAADVAALEGLGFRTVPTGAGVSGVRATGTALRTDARFVTLEESLTMRADVQPEWLGADAEAERVAGRESKFGFRLVDASGSVVRRCLRPGRLASNLSLESSTSSELESRLFTECSAAAGSPSWARPVLTLDALLWSAGATEGLAHVILPSSSGLSMSSGGGLPVQVSGVSLDLEVTYDNLPPVIDGPEPPLMDVTARAVVADRRDASWVGSGVTSSPVWTSLPGAAHKVLLPTVTAAPCLSLSWSSSSVDVDACIAAVGGTATSAFDASAVGSSLHRREEVFGAVVRAVPGGRVVRFSYMELASLGVQSLVKYLVAMTVIAGSAAVCCCNGQVRQGVCGDVTADAAPLGAGGARKLPSSKAGGRTARPGKAGAKPTSRGRGWRGKSPGRPSLTAASLAGGSKDSSEDSGSRSGKLDSLGASYLELHREIFKTKEEANLKRDRASAVLAKTTEELSDMDRTLKRLPKRAERKLHRRYGDQIAEVAASAARDQVVKSLTGRSLEQYSNTKKA